MPERKIVNQPPAAKACGPNPILKAPHPNDITDRGPPPVPDPVGSHTLIGRALVKAISVDPVAIANFQPDDLTIKIGEAVCAGLTNVRAIATALHMDEKSIIPVLNDPITMAWLSQRIEALFRCRAGLVDAALYMRAIAGDIGAIKLFYERHKMMGDKTLNVHYSGGVDVRGIPTDELARIVADKARVLPAEFRVLSENEPRNEPPKP